MNTESVSLSSLVLTTPTSMSVVGTKFTLAPVSYTGITFRKGSHLWITGGRCWPTDASLDTARVLCSMSSLFHLISCDISQCLLSKKRQNLWGQWGQWDQSQQLVTLNMWEHESWIKIHLKYFNLCFTQLEVFVSSLPHITRSSKSKSLCEIFISFTHACHCLRLEEGKYRYG